MKNRIKVIINKSNNSIEAQAIESGKVLFGRKYIYKSGSESPVVQSQNFGKDFGQGLLENKVDIIIFDRKKSRYHGRVKSFADGMRKAKVNF